MKTSASINYKVLKNNDEVFEFIPCNGTGINTMIFTIIACSGAYFKHSYVLLIFAIIGIFTIFKRTKWNIDLINGIITKRHQIFGISLHKIKFQLEEIQKIVLRPYKPWNVFYMIGIRYDFELLFLKSKQEISIRKHSKKIILDNLANIIIKRLPQKIKYQIQAFPK